MPDNTVISCRNLGKRYRLGGYGITSFRDELTQLYKNIVSAKKDSLNPVNNFWAIKNINFDVHEGETVGLIGRNGAGKSTLLKLLARITTPTQGYFDIYGKVAALLEVGTGFHPELTGKENIYLNGAILGMRRPEINRLVDQIVEFAGVEKFVDTPVKRYSSGMRVKLAFAVAAHLRQEIMIIDEVLAVGDRDFQKKCITKMGEIARHGRTIIIVSHNMLTISQLCNRTLYLKDGNLISDGDTNDVINEYLSDGMEGMGDYSWPDGIADPGITQFKVHSIRLTNDTGAITNNFGVFDSIIFAVEFEVSERIWSFALKLSVQTLTGVDIFTLSNFDDPARSGFIDPGRYLYKFSLPPKLINQGNFVLSVLAVSVNEKYLLRLEDIIKFDVGLIGRDDEVLIQSRGVVYPNLTTDYKKLESL